MKKIFVSLSVLALLAGCASSCKDEVCPMPTTEAASSEKHASNEVGNIKMMDGEISRYPVPTFEELPEDIQTVLLGIEKKKGFIPNVAYALAHRPEMFRVFFGYAGSLDREGTNITPAEKEMIIIAHSAVNGCQYCVQSHGATLRKITGNPYIADQIAINYHESDITDRQRAIIEFALKVTDNSRAIHEEDFEALHAHGLNDEDIFDIANITAFFNLSNRMMNFMAVRPDEEFYSMGR